jgi:hypothetical protein
LSKSIRNKLESTSLLQTWRLVKIPAQPRFPEKHACEFHSRVFQGGEAKYKRTDNKTLLHV